LIEHTAASSPSTPTPITPPQAKPAESTKRQIVNSRKLFLDYQIENAGQSGVGKVEIWITRDLGKSWQKLAEDAQRKNPLEVNLPDDGVFGVTLVASNGRGAGGTPPVAGEAPEMCVEVDTTKPTAQFRSVRSVTENGKSVVHISWTAQDHNLGDAPVDLFYAASAQGPWLPIAVGLKAEGEHRWTPPAELGAQAHLRLTARDAAGNVAVVVTPEAVLLEDAARPRATIRGISISTSNSAPAAPTPPMFQIVQPSPPR
jgi:hypothetical protein